MIDHQVDQMLRVLRSVEAALKAALEAAAASQKRADEAIEHINRLLPPAA